MPKMKTHKGLKKRLKVTGRGKLKHKRPNAGHLMSSKSGNRCRALRQPSILPKGPMARKMKELLGES